MVRRSSPDGDESFRTCPDWSWGPPSLLYNGYREFPGSKEQQGRDPEPSPPSKAMVMKEQSYTSTPPMGRTACTEPQCLYRASVPVQYSYTSTPPMGRTACTEPQCLYSTAIPLLPLWAVRSVQRLSACTRVHFTFFTIYFKGSCHCFACVTLFCQSTCDSHVKFIKNIPGFKSEVKKKTRLN